MYDIGLIGLAVMGQNLVLNMESKGMSVAVYNRTAAKTEAFVQNEAKGKNIRAAYSVAELTSLLQKPRVVMIMVQAGAPVDAVIAELLANLEKGDIIIDGGNSFFKDTVRRTKQVTDAGLLYLGCGVSGGEEGALLGPSMMPGGSKEAYAIAGPYLEKIAAVADGSPCCAYLGQDGAGHYVKVTHNGIEYGDMQLICEAYALMRSLAGLTPKECAAVFAEWNTGELDSYLIEITADILARDDPDTGKPLVDVILDRAGQKGTGKWTSQEALDLGVPAETIAGAVFARTMTARKDERVHAAKALPGPSPVPVSERSAFLSALKDALYASKICSYAQGFSLMSAAGEAYGWTLDFGRIALLWRGGCIIRARFLGRIKDAYDRDAALPNLMLDPFFSGVLTSAQEGWRRVVCLAAENGVWAPCFMSALSYYDGYRSAVLPHNLLQAQRDYFGAHTYERTDKPGAFHTKWL